jgi:heme/copper-type cytochrome/quinol oxidase subunit 3
MAADPARSPSTDVFAEHPDVHRRNVWIVARLLAGATIMFFVTFLFAFFYLRSLNDNGNWRPEGIDPPQSYGVAIVVLFVLSAASFGFAARRAAGGHGWLAPAGASLALGLAGCVVQGVEYAHLGFSPTDGGWASVFFGWTSLFAVFVLMAMYWVEILFAEGLRTRRVPEAVLPIGVADAAFYWGLLAGIGLLAWVLLYLV